MIARQWIGETLESDADSYFKYLEETGVTGGALHWRKESYNPSKLAQAITVRLSSDRALPTAIEIAGENLQAHRFLPEEI